MRPTRSVIRKPNNFVSSAPGIPAADPPASVPQGNIQTMNKELQDSDSYHWDQHEYALAFGDYTKARMNISPTRPAR